MLGEVPQSSLPVRILPSIRLRSSFRLLPLSFARQNKSIICMFVPMLTEENLGVVDSSFLVLLQMKKEKWKGCFPFRFFSSSLLFSLPLFSHCCIFHFTNSLFSFFFYFCLILASSIEERLAVWR